MAQFVWKGKTRQGVMTNGVLTAESKDLAAAEPGILSRMKVELLAWDATMDASFAGKDYPEGKVEPADPDPVNWFETDRYRAYEAEGKTRPEYRRYYEGKRPGKGKKARE